MFASNIIIDLSYNLSNYIQFEVFENCLKWVAYINTLFSPCYHLSRNGKCILITVAYFKDRNWICKTMYCIISLVVCRIAFCSEFPDIPDNAGRKTRRRRTHAKAEHHAFHANATSGHKLYWRNIFLFVYLLFVITLKKKLSKVNVFTIKKQFGWFAVRISRVEFIWWEFLS